MFWESIKDSLRSADFEAYLEQYPEGSFAALAKVRLEEFANADGEMRDSTDREIELSFWQSARQSGTAESLQAYLEKYPNGEFRALAEIELKQLAEA